MHTRSRHPEASSERGSAPCDSAINPGAAMALPSRLDYPSSLGHPGGLGHPGPGPRWAVWARMVLAAGILALGAGRADAMRIMTYNILNYTSGRTAEFQTVLEQTQPDVLVVEEILSQTGVNNYLSGVLEAVNPGEWSAGPFVNGTDTDNGIFYRHDKVAVVGHFVVSTALRDIDEWTVRPTGYTTSAADVRLYVVHLKASQGSTEEQQRLAEVTNMRARMETFPPGQNYMVMGDFNIYDSFEPAYQYMLSPTNGLSGVVQDPINTPGNWHNSSAFAAIHTQSPRTTQFGGGANGGLDDRFDIILVSPAIQDGEGFDILPGTYTAFGQDGLHFNAAITDAPPNAVVSPAVAQALHDGSDHLPVFADFQVPAILLAATTLDLGTVIVGATPAQDLQVSNPATLPADDLDYTMTPPAGFLAPGGSFSAAAGAAPNTHSISLAASPAGTYAGNLLLESDAADTPTFQVALGATVLDHAVASVNAGVQTTSTTVDFGTHATGAFTDQSAPAFNFGYDSLQALLEVYDAVFTGDTRFSIAGGFSPQLVGAGDAGYSIHFDDTGAGLGLYTGTLTLRTRDESLPGALDASDLVYNLIAEVQDITDVATGTPLPTYTGIGGIAPNPFGPHTEVRFALPSAQPVLLSVFDAGGRLVRDLLAQDLSAGEHFVDWNGRDDRGHDVGAGMFFIRLQTPALRDVAPVVRVR